MSQGYGTTLLQRFSVNLIHIYATQMDPRVKLAGDDAIDGRLPNQMDREPL